MAIFTGSGVAIVTPFNTDESINYDALEKLINFQIENKTDAIIICGTTGEASTLVDDEHLECIRFTVDVVNKRIPVIAGAGSNYTQHGIDLCKGSQKNGADAVLLATPYYNKCTQKGLINHFTAMANSIDIPVMLYNVPSRTSLNILPETVYQLSRIENIVAIKEASNDFTQIAEIVELCGDNMDIYSGNDDSVIPLLSLGGKGVISVVANIAPRQTHDMVMHYLNGNHQEGLKLQIELLPLVRALFKEVSPGPVKSALNLMGGNTGGLRMPLCAPEEETVEMLKTAMKNYGLL